MAEADDRSPVDQLVDLFVYAPVGLLLEYQDMLPKLIKRGKSQVQIAKVVGSMAAKQGQRAVNGRLEDVVDTASSSVAQGITDVGAMIGLAPAASGKSERPAAASGSAVSGDIDGGAPTRALPIAGYDDLRAKDVVALLVDLSPKQRARIRAHESAGRGRKTILAKLDSLDGTR